MSFKKLAISASLCSIILSQPLLAGCPTISYKNQRGSTLVLNWHPEKQDAGTLTGSFTTAVASPNCQDVIGVPQPITGYYNGNVIAFTVNYPTCKSLVAMTGNTTSDQSEIITLWLLANQVDDPRGKDWDSNVTGTDTYHKIG